MLVVGGGTFAAAAALASKSETIRSPACGPEGNPHPNPHPHPNPNPNPNPNPDPNPDPNPNPHPHPNPHPDPNASRELESITIPAPTKPHDAGGEGKPKTPRPPKSAYLCFEQVRAC